MAQKLMRLLMKSARCLNSKYDELDIRISCDELSVVGCMLLSGTRVIIRVSMLGGMVSHSHIDQGSAGLLIGVREE